MHIFSDRKWIFVGAFAVLAGMFSCTTPETGEAPQKVDATPPVATVKPETLEKHGDERIDNYFWMKERDTPEVLDYLNAENAYTEKVMAPYKELETKLFEEMKGRMVEDESSAPYKKGNYYYYTRFVEGGQYALYCRKKGSLDAEEEIMLDGNKMGEGQSFLSIRGVKVSENEKIMAFAMDTVGRRIYTIWFKNLETGELLSDKIEKATPNFVWAGDNQTLFYTKQDPTTLRYFQVYRHKLGEDTASDALVYEEKDDTFGCGVGKTLSGKYLVIGSSQTLSSEYRILESANPEGEFRVFQPRQRDHIYSVDHHEGRFFVRTNHEATNFKLMETPENKTGMENWKEVIPHREDTLLQGMTVFKDFLVRPSCISAILAMAPSIILPSTKPPTWSTPAPTRSTTPTCCVLATPP